MGVLCDHRSCGACRDDPEGVDVDALYSEESPDEEEELRMEVDLDDEYDL